MSEFNHESRLKWLEKKVQTLESIVKSAGLLDDDDFVPLSQAAKQLNCNTWVIRKRIKSDPKIKFGKHYQMNGNRYLINVTEYQDLLTSDLRSKR